MKKRMFFVLFVMLLSCGMVFSAGAQEEDSKTVLRVWDQFRTDSSSKAIETINAKFLETHPGVTIERTVLPEKEISDLLKAALVSDSGPDVIYSEMGIGFLGPLLKAGAIKDLTQEWNSNWDNKINKSARDVPTADEKTYGVGLELEVCPIYYNKTIFDNLGIKIPETMAELDQAMATLKANGVTPWAWGGKTWWNNANLVGSVLWAYLDEDTINNQMYKDISWKDNPAVRAALEKCLVEWHEKGYYPQGSEGLTDEEGLMLFSQGKAAMVPNSNYNVTLFIETMDGKYDVSSFPWPKVAGYNDKPNQVAFVGSGFVVNQNSDNTDLAIEYIDHVCATEESAKTFYEDAGYVVPYSKPIQNLNIHPWFKDAQELISDSSLNIIPGINMTAPPEVMTFLETCAVQVMTGQLTVDGFLEEFDDLWKKSVTEKNTLATFKW